MTPFPWPPKELSPNARKDRRAISGIRDRHRLACTWRAKLAKMQPGPILHIHFCPPDKRRRDLDNMFGSCKTMLDAIAKVVGQNDYEWHTQILQRCDPVPGGEVRIELLTAMEITVPMRGVVT